MRRYGPEVAQCHGLAWVSGFARGECRKVLTPIDVRILQQIGAVRYTPREDIKVREVMRVGHKACERGPDNQADVDVSTEATGLVCSGDRDQGKQEGVGGQYSTKAEVGLIEAGHKDDE